MNERWQRILLLTLLTFGVMPATTAQGEPVTLYGAATANLTTVDPQRVADELTLDVVENLFLGLTDLDPQTGAVRPELATRWEVSSDGLEYHFYLRADVPWVRWDPVAGQATAVRTVTAGDAVDAVRRACDPRVGAPDAQVLAKLISGCGAALRTPPERLDDAVLAAIGAEALDDTTLLIRLEQAAAHFPAVAAMPILYPVPQETIDQYDVAWTEPGNLVTNGAYVLDEHIRQVRRVLMRNPHLPADLRGPGNVERWVVNMVEDQATALELYQKGRLDTVVVPLNTAALALDHAGEVHLIPTLSIVYVGFAHDKPPFDNPAVRQAFAAALDQETFTSQVYPGAPMIHFTPPGVFGAPPIGEVGVGYNPDYARAQLAQAGYPGCQGMVGPIELLAALPEDQVEFLLDAWTHELGCNPDLFTVTTTGLSILRDRVDFGGMDETRPHMWTGVRWPDYPAVYNWLGDGLSCDARPETRRPCTPTDDLINQLRRNTDSGARAQLARQIEEAFFGPDGEMPVAPWYAGVNVRAFQRWYSGPIDTDGAFGGFHLDWVTLGTRTP